jgi:hypothetical protein
LKQIIGLRSLLNFNQITFGQVGVSEIALQKWFGGKLINTELLKALIAAPGEALWCPVYTKPISIITNGTGSRDMKKSTPREQTKTGE